MISLRRQRKLTCRELVELVTEYLEGTLSRRDHARFDAHLAECSNCTHYVAQFRETIRITGELRESDVPPEAADALLSLFSDWKRERT